MAVNYPARLTANDPKIEASGKVEISRFMHKNAQLAPLAWRRCPCRQHLHIYIFFIWSWMSSLLYWYGVQEIDEVFMIEKKVFYERITNRKTGNLVSSSPGSRPSKWQRGIAGHVCSAQPFWSLRYLTVRNWKIFNERRSVVIKLAPMRPVLMLPVTL